MISKLKIIGECIGKNEGNQNPLNLNDALQEANVILLDFFLLKDDCRFLGATTMQYDPGRKNSILLLRDVGGNDVSSFPTVYIDKSPDQKFYKKILRIFKKCSSINPKLSTVQNALKSEQESIMHSTSDLIDDKQTNLCTVRINQQLVGDSEYFEPIKKQYLEDIQKKYSEKYSTRSLGKDNVCYVCGMQAAETFGFCDTFKFYSANETAYIAGGFTQEDSWKNYPVCPECASDLHLGKEWILANMNRYFHGNTYLLIPSPTINQNGFYPMLKKIQEDFRDLSLRQNQESNQILSMEMEDEVFETLASQKDQATFTLLFYAASNSEFKILQEAEDILPSRFRTIIEAKKKVEKYDEFKNLKGLHKKNQTDNLTFNFGIVRTFFNSIFNNDFLDITTKILKGQTIQKQFVLHRISDLIAEKFRQNLLYFEIPKAMIFMKFLYELNLIKNQSARMEVKMENKYEDYFQKHLEFYDADWKKAVFLSGVLAQHVLDIQWQERGATPFKSRLNGLKIDSRTVKRLLPECINKLDQYKKNYYRELEEIISVLLESGEPDLRSQSVDEISFYFTMGINRNKYFKTHEEEGASNE